MTVSWPNISPITLGTVQLGMSYGITSSGRPPDMEKRFDILSTACRLGISTLDTARAYGESEAVIGTWLTNNAKTNSSSRPTLISKIPKMPSDMIDGASWVATNAKKSLQVLNVDRVWCFMLHNAQDIFNPGVRKGLEDLVGLDLCSVIGVSVYDPVQLHEALKVFPFAVAQVPGNLLDCRFREGGGIDLCEKYRVSVFCRSVFLQGLLAIDSEKLPDKFTDLSPVLASLNRLALSLDVPVLSLLMKAAYFATGASSLVLGAEQPSQVVEFAAAAHAVSKIPEDFLAALEPEIKKIDSKLFDPRYW